MKILIDISHPAEFHFFRNFIQILCDKGHDFFITARDKDCNIELLNTHKFNYVIRGKGSNTLVGKFFYLLKAVNQLFLIAKKYKPDLFISFCSPYAAIVSSLHGKPHIAFSDTEHSRIMRWAYMPYTKNILTPQCYTDDLGAKQIRFEGYKEIAYLHENYFKPNADVINLLGVQKNEKYVIVRFISWKALHDMGHKGLSLYDKIQIVKNLSKYARVFISSEEELPDEIKRYKINIPAMMMHDALAFAALFVGEGATMAAESAVLGVPAVFNYLRFGYVKELEEKYHLIFHLNKLDDIISKTTELLTTPNLKELWQGKKNHMLETKIDVTSFMVWFVENYPHSVKKVKEKYSL